ncbi:MAG: glycosyl hydrolase [Anaerolineae bacterium]
MSHTLGKDDEKAAAVDGLLQAMTWRCIGPPRGGRVVTVAGDPDKPAVFYFGACAGGVWKTTDAGVTWQNISDGFFQTASVGALAVADSDPNVIYAGMGEATIRIDVSPGDGVYKSTDGGQTWAHTGLAGTRHIGKIRVHPANPDLVYVAALGHAFGPNEQRGVFRSQDGGQTWQKVLYKSERAGAVDLALDPGNPRILFASIWQARRTFWNLSSGGPDSGLYKSTDGGDTWTDISANPGLPEGIKGKIGLAVSPARPGRVWALVEASEPGLYRSDDGGATWRKLTDKGELRYRPWYFSHVIAHPQEPNTVYILNLDIWKSIDGGQTFNKVASPHGDNHDLWIDPRRPERMIQGNDGGACVSFNGGETWSTIYNQLTAQFYHVAVDNQFPYRVYGTQQDNSSISVPSRTAHGAVTWADCYPAGTGESGYIAVHPQDPNLVYVGAVGSSPGGGGALQRYDHRTGQIRLVTVWPEEYSGYGAKDLRYRFPWTFPIVFSPHDPDVLYSTGNVVFRTTDEGHSWQAISPDLTRNDPSKLEASGGPITKDTTGAEHYATISTFLESPHQAGVFWAGSDDGLIHLSRDGGRTWQNVTPPDLPEWSFISLIEQSRHDPASAYVAATRYKLDDYRPYLYKTGDFGQTWQKITNGIPDHEFTRAIRADPGRAGLLYAGTETGLYISLDDGASWRRWQNNLPVVPVYDMVIKDNDLVLATHGRSFWILDDLTPLHQLPNGGKRARTGPHLYCPRPAYRQVPDLTSYWFADEGKNYHIGLGVPAIYHQQKTETGAMERTFLDAGQSAPDGVIVYYHLDSKPEEGTDVSLAFLDARGRLIREFKPKPPGADEEDAAQSQDLGPWLPVEAGTNRFVWNLRYPNAHKVPGDKTVEAELRGPLVVPGSYRVRLTVGGQTWSESFEVLKDPRVTTDQADLEAQLDLLLQIRDKLSAAHDAVNTIRAVKQQIAGWEDRFKSRPQPDPALAAAAAALKEKLSAIEDKLVLPGEHSPATMMNHPARLNIRLASLVSVVDSADAAPTTQARAVYEEVAAEIDAQLAALDGVFDTDLVALNDLIRQAGVPAIVA